MFGNSLLSFDRVLGVDLSGSVDRFLIYVRNDRGGSVRLDMGKKVEWTRGKMKKIIVFFGKFRKKS